jgi:hypothetical protein
VKVTDEEKRILDLQRQLESPQCRDALLQYALAMVQAQKALKADFGLGAVRTAISALETQGGVA